MINEQGQISRNDKSITIGNYVWIGNRVTIQKGSVIGDKFIIGSNSLVNKKLQAKEGSVYGGIPVRLVAENKCRIFCTNMEYNIDRYFKENPNEYCVCIDDLNVGGINV